MGNGLPDRFFSKSRIHQFSLYIVKVLFALINTIFKFPKLHKNLFHYAWFFGQALRALFFRNTSGNQQMWQSFREIVFSKPI